MSCRILLDCDQSGNAETGEERFAFFRGGALGSDHDHVTAFRGKNLFENDVEDVGAGEGFARCHVLLDLVVISGLMELVGKQNVNDVGFCRRFVGGHDLKTVGNGSVKGRSFSGADDYIDAGISHAESLGAALAAVADHGDCFSV